MKRINFPLIECQKELAYARQALVCLCGAIAAALLLVLAYHMEVMTPLILFSGLGVIGFLCGLGVLCVFMPDIKRQIENVREARRYRDHITADNGRHVDPHH